MFCIISIICDYMQTTLDGHKIDKVDVMAEKTEKKFEPRKAGTKGIDAVESVTKGTHATLIGEHWDKYNIDGKLDPNASAIKVVGKSGANLVMKIVSEDSKYYHSSHYGKWCLKLGCPPVKGQTVGLVADAKGYWKFDI